jgi:hypothetical protein
MTEILELIESYINMSDIFWSVDLLDDDFELDEKTLEWIHSEADLMDKMEDTRNLVLSKINGDEELFSKYLGLGSCIKNEEYEQAEIFKNEIIGYENKI